jgi:hypothetical protein
MYFGTKPYDLAGHIEHYGSGVNMYRGEDFAQPSALQDGDILANGLVISGKPYIAFNSSIGLDFANGSHRIVAPRIPLQLQSERTRGVLPAELTVGQILQTGDVVLSKPKPIGPVEWHDNQDETEIHLTGGWYGHEVGVASDLPIAVFGEAYPPSPSTSLGTFALEQVMRMKEEARINLPRLGQLTLDI